MEKIKKYIRDAGSWGPTKQAFTIVEMMVVLVLFGIVVSIGYQAQRILQGQYKVVSNSSAEFEEFMGPAVKFENKIKGSLVVFEGENGELKLITDSNSGEYRVTDQSIINTSDLGATDTIFRNIHSYSPTYSDYHDQENKNIITDLRIEVLMDSSLVNICIHKTYDNSYLINQYLYERNKN